MAQEGTFTKVEKSSEQMYGPKGLLVCGYPESEQQTLLSLLKENELSACPVIFATNGDIQKSLKEAFNLDHKHGQGENSDMKRVAILSGFTQNELHTIMECYKGSTLPIQLWAALTPISENWSVAALLDELSAEHEEMNNKKKK